MPLKYDHKDASRCWPAGDYEAVLEKVEDATSKAGNEMQVLTWRLYNASNESITVKDFIVVPAAVWKLEQIAIALDKHGEFLTDTFQVDDFLDCNVTVLLMVQKQEGHPERNAIKTYKALSRAIAPAMGPAKTQEGPTEDEIPF